MTTSSLDDDVNATNADHRHRRRRRRQRADEPFLTPVTHSVRVYIHL